MDRTNLLLGILVLLLGGLGQSRAGVIYSSISTPDGEGYVVGYSNDGNNYSEGFHFTPTGSSYTLSEIRAVFLPEQEPYTVTLSLNADKGGLPGQVLESFTFTTNTSGYQTFSANSVLQPILTQDSQYWLVASSSNAFPSGAWERAYNQTPTLGAGAVSVNGGSWTSDFTQPGMFEIDGTQLTTTPAPSSVTLLGIGAFGILGFCWRRRKPVVARTF